MLAVINCHQSVWHSFLQPIRVIHDVGRQVLNLDTATNRARSVLGRTNVAESSFNGERFKAFWRLNIQSTNIFLVLFW